MSTSPEEVFDILDVGPNHRFTVMGEHPTLVSNCIQSTGHTNLLTMLVHLKRLRTERNLDFRFVVCDFHDEFITECNPEDADAVVQLIADALEATNQELGGTIELQCPPEVCKSFADFKCE